MEERFVTWGTEKELKKVFIALQLRKHDFKVEILLFDEAVADKAFVERMQNEWCKGVDVELPENHRTIDRPLSEESLLPVDIRVDKTGKIRVLQNEWAYLLLTEKLVESIVEEIKDLNIKTQNATAYSKDDFDSAKSIWERILDHGKERNISKEKIDEMKKDINEIFDRLKNLRTEENKRYADTSDAIYSELKTNIEQAQKDISDFKPAKELFDTLKELRGNVNKLSLRKPQREELHAALDQCFDTLKNRGQQRDNARNDKRIKDLTEFISKLEGSVAYDKRDLDYQLKRTNDRNVNQLEAQLRAAKIKMLEEKVASKMDKLNDMKRTLQELTGK